jgi:hypothetical protein
VALPYGSRLSAFSLIAHAPERSPCRLRAGRATTIGCAESHKPASFLIGYRQIAGLYLRLRAPLGQAGFWGINAYDTSRLLKRSP